MLRRLITVALVAAATAAGSLWWLHDGDVDKALATVQPVVAAQWDAATLARDAGVTEPAPPASPAP
jgi:hypothetical protein